jgi:hypothetical protein
MKRKSRDAKFSHNVPADFSLAVQRVCKRKVRYADKGPAIRGARAFMQNAKGLLSMGAYQCRHCNGWHITRNTDGAPLAAGKKKFVLVHLSEEL